ncbi:MAG: hypothetical protein GF346_01620, partial [Candidatus Eisenbacteria bacterium]|nr:hypothetical protein [Candidatus Latescibacterota bacterium]MBD3301129.1 hypothetical protein [Candidatus Eisenbacteria bacterium]
LETVYEPAGAARGDAGPQRTLRGAIEEILSATGTTDRQKAFLIRKLWEGIPLPAGLAEEVEAAYRRLGTAEDPEAYVAVRSSGREEDREEEFRAGEFLTFLQIRGTESVLAHLRLAWSGLWTERAIRNRARAGAPAIPDGGGVVVQRMVSSRVSGVMQTINVAERRFGEIVINAGLGLGEGIVSGLVGADQIVVEKEEPGSSKPEGLRLRYVTNDKKEKVVADRRRGFGTVRVESLYHERFRAALEYVEIEELVRAGTRLEQAYGLPLDIEFGIEGAHVRILQVRPVVTFAAVVRETVDRRPIGRCAEEGQGRTEEPQ